MTEKTTPNIIGESEFNKILKFLKHSPFIELTHNKKKMRYGMPFRFSMWFGQTSEMTDYINRGIAKRGIANRANREGQYYNESEVESDLRAELKNNSPVFRSLYYGQHMMRDCISSIRTALKDNMPECVRSISVKSAIERNSTRENDQRSYLLTSTGVYVENTSDYITEQDKSNMHRFLEPFNTILKIATPDLKSVKVHGHNIYMNDAEIIMKVLKSIDTELYNSDPVARFNKLMYVSFPENYEAYRVISDGYEYVCPDEEFKFVAQTVPFSRGARNIERFSELVQYLQREFLPKGTVKAVSVATLSRRVYLRLSYHLRQDSVNIYLKNEMDLMLLKLMFGDIIMDSTVRITSLEDLDGCQSQ